MNKEDILALIAAIIAVAAILINVNIKGVTPENIFDALKDLSGLIINIIVLLIALKIYKKQDYGKFKEKFEEYLQDWVFQNEYLIDSNKKIYGQNENKQFYYMLSKPNHKNLVFKEKLASNFPDTGGQLNPKGAFLYTDTNNKEEIIFGLNQSFFKSKAGEDLPVAIEEIADKIIERIDDNFSEIGLECSKSNDSRRITVSLKNMEKTEKNAKILIDLVEFVKSMILAIA